MSRALAYADRRSGVSTTALSSLDLAGARTAYDAAFEAAQGVNCGGQPMMMAADDDACQDRRFALTQGAPAWTFQGRCG